MKFHLIDKIEQIEPGKRLVGIKALSLAEEYLGDHFPVFPVMPGVLMLEAMVQAAAWMVRLEQDFSKSMVVLSAARNVRYGNFVAPGGILRIEVELLKAEGNITKFKGIGTVNDGQTAVQGRIELKSFNVADFFAPASAADEQITARLKEGFKLIGGTEALKAATSH